jgi:hypothetical protein
VRTHVRAFHDRQMRTDQTKTIMNKVQGNGCELIQAHSACMQKARSRSPNQIKKSLVNKCTFSMLKREGLTHEHGGKVSFSSISLRHCGTAFQIAQSICDSVSAI